MKKLAIATLALCAASAWAGVPSVITSPVDGKAVISGTDLENYGTNPFAVIADDAGDTGATSGVYWRGEKGESALATEDGNTYLKVDVDSELQRYIADNPDVSTNATIAGEYGGIYFDAKVQFTASDATDGTSMVTDGDKLLVWLQETDSATNLVVTAAEISQSGTTEGEATKTDYVIDNVTVVPGEWTQLTISAVQSETENGFTYTDFSVYVGGELATCNGKSVFSSLTVDNGTAQTLTYAGFTGSGAVDDISWGTIKEAVVEYIDEISCTYTGEVDAAEAFTAYYAFDDSTEKIEWPYTYDEGELPVTNIVKGSVKTMTIWVKVNEGYKVTNDGWVLDTEKDDNYEYLYKGTYTLTEDAKQTITFTIAKNGDTPTETPEITPDDGKTVQETVDAATSVQSIKLANVTSADQVTIESGSIKIGDAGYTFPTYYTATLSTDLTEITLALNDTAAETVKIDTSADEPLTVSDDEVGLAVTVSNEKLYYGLADSATVGGTYATPTDDDDWTKGNGGKLTLKAAKSGSARFYKICIDDVLPSAKK